MELPKVKSGTPMPACKPLRQESEEMTLRDYFAANAPITMSDARDALSSIGEAEVSGNEIIEMLAHMRGMYADAMLAERAK